MRRTTYSSPDVDDATGLAGWMYSDLLLGLTVVFLATISFVPGIGPVAGKPEIAYTYARVHPVDFKQSYTNEPPTRLLADIAAFKVEQGLADTAYVTKAQFVGTFSQSTEAAVDGLTRAVQLRSGVDTIDPRTFRLAAVSTRAVGTSSTPEVTVKLTFASEVQVVTGS